MGTLSLIFGIIGIVVGLSIGGYALIGTVGGYALIGTDFSTSFFLIFGGIAVISIVIGSGLVIKYDNDKKKSENS